MQNTIEEALHGVEQAAKFALSAQIHAENEAQESKNEAIEWKNKYLQQKSIAESLRKTLEDSQTRLPSSLRLPSRSTLSMRRHTIPTELPSANHNTTHSSLTSSFSSSRSKVGHIFSTNLSSLAAYLLLQSASFHLSSNANQGHDHACDNADHHNNHHHHDSAMDHSQSHLHDQTTISVADDGRSGVGAAAAAAVSVALAQSWAAVAGGRAYSSETASVRGPDHHGRARFKLVAAVPRSLHQSSDSVTEGDVLQQQQQGSGSIDMTPPRGITSNSTIATTTTTPTDNTPASINNNNNNNLALESLDDAHVLDDRQEATWRASGSHLKLHWMSAPKTVLVVYKPTAEVLQATVKAITWLINKGLMVYVEPGAYIDVKSAVGAHMESNLFHPSPSSSCSTVISHQNGDNADNAVFGAASPRSMSCNLAAALAEETRAAVAHGAIDTDDLLSRLLFTWNEEQCPCNDLIPQNIADSLDFVLTLGGDGTVLWSCSLFGIASVPPIVPLAMGSLGFMTPFPISRMDAVLARVSSVAHGFPLMLRHRLQCRILRAGESSTADLSHLRRSPCGEDVLVLNEVVIDRGMTASLANLQCYVDHNFVTTIQGDGLIVSTPTGSTAYNLAAGGSMVHPSVPCILFTPICPHTLSSRPLVFPEHVTLRVKVPSNSRAEAYCSFDGKGRQTLKPGDSVLIHLSQWPVPMVCNLDASHDWFLAVRDGLHWNRRQMQKPI